MADDPIRRYSDASKEFNEAYLRVRDLGGITADVGRYLNNKPYDLGVTNSDVGLPPEMAMAEKQYTLNADNWPSAKQIAEALVALYAKRKQVNDVWTSLSPTDKALVNPPDTK